MTASQFTRRNAIRLLAGGVASTAIFGKATYTAIAQTAGDIQTVDTDLLNLRSGPGLSFDIIETLSTGAEVQPDAAQRKAADGVNWIFVTVVASGNEGWVDSSYLGTGTASGTPESDVAAAATTTKWVSVADANLRDGAGLANTVIATLPVGEEVTVTGETSDADGYTWYPVTVAAGSGWLADIVLTDEQPPAPGLEQGAAITVTTDFLNLREEPGVDTAIIGTYAFGTAGTILSAEPLVVDEITWHQVELDEDGEIGWFAEQYIGAGGGTGGDATSNLIEVADGPVNLRTSPGLAGEIVGSAETGARATLIVPDFTAADGYQWISVRFADQTGKEGWIASEFVTFVQE